MNIVQYRQSVDDFLDRVALGDFRPSLTYGYARPF